MADPQIRFEDGAGYARMMGIWSRLAGEVFLDWLAPPPALRWVDVGCGTGAFSELVVERCAPAAVEGVDPSEGQLAYARGQLTDPRLQFRLGDAAALPFADRSRDAAVMALVIFFLPEPAKGVAEMARVVRRGGLVATYAWDILGGGFPLEAIFVELRAIGLKPILPPSSEASRIEPLHDLWSGAGLEAVETREIKVERSFADFEDFWTTSLLGSSLRMKLATMSAAQVERLKEGVRARLPPNAAGRVTCEAHANAVKGRVRG